MHPIHYGNAWENGDGIITVLFSGWDSDTLDNMAEAGETMLGSWARVVQGNFAGVLSQPLLQVSLKDEQASIRHVAPNAIGHVDYIKTDPRRAGKKWHCVFGSTTSPPSKGTSARVAPTQTFCRIDLLQNDGVSVSDFWYAGHDPS
jgi:carotenoid cleavage dioxygenase-like enzyme